MRRSATPIAVAVIMCLAGAVAAADFQVVGHPGSTPDSVSKRDLARIFLKQKTSWPSGQSAEPADLKGTPDARRQFCDQILRRSTDMVESYWQGQVFAGKATPPTIKDSDREVVEFVRHTPGAVGYVAPGTDTSGVKVIQVID